MASQVRAGILIIFVGGTFVCLKSVSGTRVRRPIIAQWIGQRLVLLRICERYASDQQKRLSTGVVELYYTRLFFL